MTHYNPHALDNLLLAVCEQAVRDVRRTYNRRIENPPTHVETIDARKWLLNEGAEVIFEMAGLHPDRVRTWVQSN